MSPICESIHAALGALRRHVFPFERSDIPLNGIYVLFEGGERAHGCDRIVRIGTHTGNNQLPSRLRQHFLDENKDRSIFRKNIGRALLSRDKDPFLAHWEIDLTTKLAREHFRPGIDLARQQNIEKVVSEYIRNSFTFAVLSVEVKEDRLRLESALVSAVSLCQECQPSDGWLGRYSPKDRIREGGLWQVNELYKTPISAEEWASLSAKALIPDNVRSTI